MITLETVAQEEARNSVDIWCRDFPNSTRHAVSMLLSMRKNTANEYRKAGQTANAEYYTLVVREIARYGRTLDLN